LSTASLSALTLFTVASLAGSAQVASAQPKPVATGVQTIVFDGAVVGLVSSVRGGLVVADAITEPGPKGVGVKKRPSKSRVEPLVFDVQPVTMAKAFTEWLGNALTGAPAGRSAEVVTYDYSSKEVARRAFTNLRVTQIEFPGLDATSKESAFITVTAEADSVVSTKGSGSPSLPKSQPARASNFKLALDGLDTSRVATISSITVKISKGRAEASNFVVTLSEASSDQWERWHETFIVKGDGTDANEKKGAIEVLDASMKTPIMVLSLEGVGILRVAPLGDQDANPKSAVRRIEAQLYVESVRLEIR